MQHWYCVENAHKRENAKKHISYQFSFSVFVLQLNRRVCRRAEEKYVALLFEDIAVAAIPLTHTHSQFTTHTHTHSHTLSPFISQ